MVVLVGGWLTEPGSRHFTGVVLDGSVIVISRYRCVID